MKKAIKPKVYGLGYGGYNLIYKCGKCEYGFNMAHEGFDYCPHCGNKIDWGVIVEVNAEWKEDYLDATRDKQKEMRAFIDKINKGFDDGERRVMPKTDKTREEIIRKNISYYLNSGWSKSQLLNEGFFTEKDFEIYESAPK